MLDMNFQASSDNYRKVNFLKKKKKKKKTSILVLNVYIMMLLDFGCIFTHLKSVFIVIKLIVITIISVNYWRVPYR